MMTTTSTKESPRRSELFNVRLWQESIDEEQVELRGQVQHLLSGETHYFRNWSTLVTLLDAMFSKLTSELEGEEPGA